ncbi:MAG: ATP-binding cassette domain-containing protein [Treponema sp.]|nr:ATP-binding cassette domain-containing protein [Treponema sp.]
MNLTADGIAVNFDSVSFSYGDTKILEETSFHIHNGEFIAMVGPNGSGKTTVLKLLLGLETPSAGKIEISNANLAYVSQHMPSDNLFPITVRDIVRMGLLQPAKGYSKETCAVAEAMEKTGISELALKPYSSLSGGQKRRTLVTRALAAGPQILVLDEPTANMDTESEIKLYETLGLYKGKMTILIVTHDTEFVTSLTDKVLCLGDGYKVVQHNTEANASDRHGGKSMNVRVLHGENVTCC